MTPDQANARISELESQLKSAVEGSFEAVQAIARDNLEIRHQVDREHDRFTALESLVKRIMAVSKSGRTPAEKEISLMLWHLDVIEKFPHLCNH